MPRRLSMKEKEERFSRRLGILNSYLYGNGSRFLDVPAILKGLSPKIEGGRIRPLREGDIEHLDYRDLLLGLDAAELDGNLINPEANLPNHEVLLEDVVDRFQKLYRILKSKSSSDYQ